MRGLILTLAACAFGVSAASAQSGLTLTATTHPNSFDGASTAPCSPAAVTCFDELVKSEPLTLTITTTPTPVFPPPAILQPRRFSVWLGAEFAPGFPIGAFFPGLTSPELVYLSTGAATAGGFILPVPVIDSFFDPFGPVFGPPLAGPTNAYTATFGLDLAAAEFFLAANGQPLTLILQAIAEDTPGSATPILLSNALEQFLGGQPSVLVGNSFGGHIAVKIAINRPDLVKGLVLAGASGLIEKSMVSDIQIRPSREWLARKIGELFHDRSKMNPSDVERAHAVLSQRGGARAMVKLSRTARKNHVGDQLALVKAPTLILWGRHDIVTPPEAAEQFAARIPRNKLVWLETCGHAPMIECPEEFGAALNAFLDEVS